MFYPTENSYSLSCICIYIHRKLESYHHIIKYVFTLFLRDTLIQLNQNRTFKKLSKVKQFKIKLLAILSENYNLNQISN